MRPARGPCSLRRQSQGPWATLAASGARPRKFTIASLGLFCENRPLNLRSAGAALSRDGGSAVARMGRAPAAAARPGPLHHDA